MTFFLRFAACAIGAAAISFPAIAQQAKGAASVSAQDAAMFRAMAEADLTEVEAGKLAAGKASSGEVKKFAQHMVEDHGKGLKEGEALAKSKGIEAPSAPDKKHQAALQKLESAKDFDRAYMDLMVKDHQEALKLVQNAAKSAKDGDIKAAAAKKVPVVEEHLKMAREISSSLSSSAKAAK
jgi:putative membrane protein